jgi:hypothetical protein
LNYLENFLGGWRGLLLVAGSHFPVNSFDPVQKLKCRLDELVAYQMRKTDP